MTYLFILTQLNQYFKCSLCYDSLIIQIDLVVAETDSVNYGHGQRPNPEVSPSQVNEFTPLQNILSGTKLLDGPRCQQIFACGNIRLTDEILCFS